MEPFLNNFRKSYFEWEPSKLLKDPLDAFIRSAQGQDIDLLQEKVTFLLNSDLATTFPVQRETHRCFVKLVIQTLEEAGVEVVDDLYNLLAQRIEKPHFFKTYFFPCEGHVSLMESPNLVSEGTTGLRTWQAARYLVDYFTKNRITDTKTILELGSGVGLVGIALLKLKLFQGKFIFSDFHPKVLETVGVNCENNEISKKNFDIIKLNWEEFDEEMLDPNMKPNLVIGSDIVFNPEVLPKLCKVLKIFCQTQTQIVIACTIRNCETIRSFVKILSDANLTCKDVTDKTISVGDDDVVVFSIGDNNR